MEDLNNKLRNQFNPDGSKLRDLQLRQLEILKYFDAFCKQNNITYWLSSGTCLGAVRHQGFIPWDDDIDVEMLSSDYKKFLKAWNNTAKYSIQNRHTEKYYIFSFSKIRENNTYYNEPGSVHYSNRGVFIDIFCMEHFYKFPAKVGDYFLRRISNLINTPNPHRINKMLFSIGKSLLYFSGSILRPFMKISYNKNCVRHAFGSCNADYARFLNEIFPLTSLKFEDMHFPVPGNYNAYLKRLYGNYMEIPNVDSPSFHTHATDYSLSTACEHERLI